MTSKSTPCCGARLLTRNSGLTLIEVVAALVLAATALVAALVSCGRAQRQQHLAELRLAAIGPAEELLLGWIGPQGDSVALDPSDLPAQGPVTDHPEWTWKLSALPRPLPSAEAPFDVHAFRLQILATARAPQAPRELLAVEFVGRMDLRPELMTAAGGP